MPNCPMLIIREEEKTCQIATNYPMLFLWEEEEGEEEKQEDEEEELFEQEITKCNKYLPR